MCFPFCEPILCGFVHYLSILDGFLDSFPYGPFHWPVIAPRSFSYRIFFDPKFLRCIHEGHACDARALDNVPRDCDPTADSLIVGCIVSFSQSICEGGGIETIYYI
jgi:hypothetical protein